MTTVYIKPLTPYYFPIKYVLKVIGNNHGISFMFKDNAIECNLIWDHEHPKSQPIAQWFYNALNNDIKKINHQNVFAEKQIILNESKKEDLIATIFYMINCIQEFACEDKDLDNHGRFSFAASYQYSHNSIDDNLVQIYIKDFLKQSNLNFNNNRSTFFISHDIDTIYGSLLQDSFWAVKNLKPMAMLKIIAMELSRRPHWKNMDKIIKINSEYDIKSVFFWVVNKGISQFNVKNADYSIEKEQNLLKYVSKNGYVNGLHKSVSSMTIDEELDKCALIEPYNRYHFLKYHPVIDWKKLSDSRIKFDSSLGFAERYGFRNSFGSAFQPFDLINNKPYNFVISPLIFMDTTFYGYMNVPRDSIANSIQNLVEKNPENCCFGLLWHNTCFTDFKYHSLLKEYRKVLSFIYESKMKCLLPDEIIKQYTLEWE